MVSATGPTRRTQLIITATVAAAGLALPCAAAAAGPRRGDAPEILGGRSAVGSTLGMVARIVDTRGGEQAVCSGTVVSPDLVLTAGHCAVNLATGATDSPSGYAVRTGSRSLGSAGHTSRVARVIPEPSFDPATFEFLICGQTLQQGFPSSSSTRI